MKRMFVFRTKDLMMIKKAALSFAGLCLASYPALFSSGFPTSRAPVTDVYKAGPIRLLPDPAFGKATDWNILFYNMFCDLTVAPDGSIFVADSRENKIFKFDAQGRLVRSFGQKGQGPGDLNAPGDLSVLDGKYLVVGHYGTDRKISLFDLDGQFNRLLTTERPAYHPVALREGNIAYISTSYRGEGPTATKTIESVVIRGIDSPRETRVAQHTFNWGGIMLRTGGSIVFGDGTAGGTFIAATKDGNLLVGNSLETSLDVYSPDGVKLSTIDLGLEPIPVTKGYRTRYKDYQIGGMRKEHGSDARIMQQIKQLEEASFDHLFSDHLPLYREVLVDAEGNLLFFTKTECLGDCPILIRVYSPEGKFVCETELREESFALTVDPRIKNMVFGSEGLIAMVEVKEAEDFELRLIKVNYGPPRAE